MTSDQVGELFQLIWAYDGVKVIVGHVAVNLVVALGASLKNGDFQLGKLAEFLYRKLLPYVAIYYIVNAFGDAAGVAALGPTVFAIIEATLAGDLADNLQKLGVNWGGLSRFLVKPDSSSGCC
jgi:hypothetical protein